MELRHLRYFVAVAEYENITSAAHRLHVSQPALSRQIRDLEEEIGCPLLKRSAKSVRLTQAGRVFLEESKKILSSVEAAVNAVKHEAKGSRDELHIGYAPVPTIKILPQALREFQRKRPDIRVKLYDYSPEQMIQGLRKKTLDLAFMVRPTKQMLRGLRFEQLMEDDIRIALPPTHRFAKMRSVELSQLAQEPLVAYSKVDYPEYYHFITSLFKKYKLTPNIVEEHEGGVSLVTAVEAGSGVAFVSESLSYTIGSRLKLIPLSPLLEPLEIGVAWSPKNINVDGEDFLKTTRKLKFTI